MHRATCYVNSLVQQLYMMPGLRESLFHVSVPSLPEDLATNVLFQLQTVFANLKVHLYLPA